MQTLQLKEAWGRHTVGDVLRVYERGMKLEPDVVDPKRAETLLALGLAVELTPAVAPKDQPAKRRAKKSKGVSRG